MKKIVLPIIIVLAVLLGGYLAMAYTIQPGDTLSKIAQDNNTTWQKLAVDNNIQDPDLIFVGDNIDITNVQEFGGVNIPTIVALFETSLASKITSSQTTMTLVSGTTKNSTTLSGTYGFIIDEGTASEEFVLASCTDTACSAMRRGLSVIDGWTEVSALKFEHRRGASVKITNYPQLAIISRILDGTTTTPAILLADTSLANSSLVGNQYALVDYVNSYVAGGFSALNVGTTKGLYALGTSPETVGINLHNQSGLAFESGTGKLKVATTTPSATGITISDGYVKVATTTDFAWSGSHTFANATTTGKQVIGYSHLNNATTSLNVFGDSTLTGGVNINGSATTTGSIYVGDSFRGATSTLMFNLSTTTSDKLIISAPTATTTSAADYTKLKEVYIKHGGTAYVVFECGITPSSGTINARIYKNGVAVGTERSCASEFQLYVEGLYNLVAGDLIQLYGKTTDSAARVWNFNLYADKVIPPQNSDANVNWD